MNSKTGPVNRLERLAAWPAWMGILALAVLALARLLLHDRALIFVWANSFTAYLYLPGYVLLAWALGRRRWQLAVPSTLVVVCHLAWVLPDFRAAESPPPGIRRGTKLRIFSTNVRATNHDLNLLAEIEAADADLLLIQEYSPFWKKRLEDAGIPRRYPHRVERVRNDNFGAAIFSKWPLEESEIWIVNKDPILRATVNVRSVRLRIYNIHPRPPARRTYQEWKSQWSVIARALEKETGPLVAIGDFNATQHSVWLKRLTAGRYHSAHRQAGRGTATTWPNGLLRLPPIRIDHALLSPDIFCTDIAEGTGAGSDHKPLSVELTILGPSEVD